MVRKIFVIICYCICHVFYRVRTHGYENIPQEGAAILCSNHVHFFDSISIVVHMKRMIYEMAKEELFESKFGNWLFTRVGAFPVSRGKGDVAAVNTANHHLENGDLLLLFPEGTRNGLAKGQKFKKGAAYMAIQNKVPLVPIGVSGEFKFMHKVHIKVGKPIDVTPYLSEDGSVDARKVVELTHILQDEVVKLRDNKVKGER